MTLDLQRCAIDGHRAPPSGERLLQLMLHDFLCGMAVSNDNMECDSSIKDCIYRDQARVSCRNLTAHLDKLNPN